MSGDAFAIQRFRRGTSPLEANASQDGMQFETEPMISVPLPIEIPPVPNLSQLPSEVLHSGTVETLIAHNEDLIARLKVNLRRNALLEQQILGLEKQINELRSLNETLEDQVHIVRERDRVIAQKNTNTTDKINALTDEMEFLRRQLQESQAAAASQKSRLETYTRRIRKWVRPGLNKLQKANLQNREFIHHTELLRRDLAQRDIEVGELSRQVAELRSFQRERERNFQKDQGQLVEKYESAMAEIRKENEELSLKLSFYRDRSSLLDEMTKRQINSENAAVQAERRAQDLENMIQTKVKDLELTSEEAKRDARNLKSQVEILRDELRKSREEKERLETENDRLKDQLDSLQILWNESRKNIESFELKVEALNQINQELSQRLKEQRTQAENEVLNLNSIDKTSDTPTESTFRKIDSLLASIESGFPGSDAGNGMRARDVEFKEESGKNPEAEL
jgi:chromosome segregation ATPase